MTCFPNRRAAKQGLVCWKNIEWGDFTSILSCWAGGRIGMTPNSKSALSNTEMFPDSMLEGAELANRVTETAEATESALKEMDS